MICRLSSLIIVLVMVCPVAIAQSSRPDSAAQTQSKETDSDVKGLLAGPEVQPGSDELTQYRFDGSTVGRGARGRTAVPTRRWFVLLRTLELSQDQDDEIRPIIQSLQKAAKEHNQENGKRIRKLQKQVQQARRNNRDVPRVVRQELGKLRAKGPKAETHQKRIWDLLTVAQQEQMRESLAEIRQEMAKQREARITDQMPVSDKPAMKQTEQDKKTDAMDEQTKQRVDFLKSQKAPATRKGNPDR